MPATEAANDGADEIRQLARTYQYDRYISALLLPRRYREALIILAAFAAELQRIPLMVTEPMMAAIRLQWWRDELIAAAAPGGGTRRSGHLLHDALVKIATSHQLPFGLLQGMIDAAETELDATPFAQAAETRQVLLKLEGAQFELAGRVLGSEAPREVWSEAAIAYGGARLAAEHTLRHRAGMQLYVSREDTGAEEALVKPARAALNSVRARRRQIDVATRRALLPLATVAPSLREFATQSEQKDATNAGLSNFTRARSILWAHWRGRF